MVVTFIPSSFRCLSLSLPPPHLCSYSFIYFPRLSLILLTLLLISFPPSPVFTFSFTSSLFIHPDNRYFHISFLLSSPCPYSSYSFSSPSYFILIYLFVFLLHFIFSSRTHNFRIFHTISSSSCFRYSLLPLPLVFILQGPVIV